MKHRPHTAAEVGTGCGQQRQHRCKPGALAQWHNWEMKDDELCANLGKKAKPNLKKEREGRRGGEEEEEEKEKKKVNASLGMRLPRLPHSKDLCIGDLLPGKMRALLWQVQAWHSA